MSNEALLSKPGWWLVLFLATGVLLWPRLIWLVHLWAHDGLYSFCFLIPPLSAFLVWKKRGRIFEGRPQPSPFGLILALTTVALVLFFDFSRLRLYSFTPLFIIGIFAGSLWAIYGFRVVRLLAFPLLILLFLLPVPPSFVAAVDYPMQEFCARGTTSFAQIVGIPAYRIGATVCLPNFTMGIAPACNGLRSSFAMLALAVIYGYLCEGPLVGKVFLTVAAVPLAYLANFFRLFTDAVLLNKLGRCFFPYEQVWDFVWGFLTFLLGSFLLMLMARALGCRKFRSIS